MPADRGLRRRATVFVAGARVLLPLVRTERALRLLAGHGGRQSPAHDTNQATGAGAADDRALEAVRIAGGRLRADCLAQSVALAAMLQRSGQAPTLVLGCRRYGAVDWGAHAWVEVDGRQFDPVVQPDHAALARLRAANNWRIVPANG